jgi:ribosomal protein S18 acetylase RimI-like enzyme
MTTIRQIRESDVRSFRDVLDSVSRERLFLAMLEAPPLESVRQFVSSSVERDRPHFVATEGEEIVGWCDIIPGDPETGTAHLGRLGMGVRKDHRGRKIGQHLAEAAVGKARAIGLEKIEIEVYSSNDPAVGLYRKLGFEEEGRRKHGRLVDGKYDDIVLMALYLRKPADGAGVPMER